MTGGETSPRGTIYERPLFRERARPWPMGKGAEMLDLRGEVQMDQFEAIRQGLDPTKWPGNTVFRPGLARNLLPARKTSRRVALLKVVVDPVRPTRHFRIIRMLSHGSDLAVAAFGQTNE